MKKEVKSNLVFTLFVISLVLLVFIGSNLSGRSIFNNKEFKILNVKENTNGIVITLENTNLGDIPSFKVVFEGKNRLERNLFNGFNSNENEKEFLVSISNIEDYELINIYACEDVNCDKIIENSKESYVIEESLKKNKIKEDTESEGILKQQRVFQFEGVNGEQQEDDAYTKYIRPNFLLEQQGQLVNIFPYSNQQFPQESLQDNVIDKDSEQLKYNGYIVEFTEEPLAVKNKKLENSKSINKQQELALQKQKIDMQHSNFITKLQQLSLETKVINEFTKILNGIVISKDITKEKLEELKNDPDVKRISFDTFVYANLMDSISFINADDVWRLNQLGDLCATDYCSRSIRANPITGAIPLVQCNYPCLTGQGIKIGILDTGVDYNHQDLGGCFGLGCKVVDGWDFVTCEGFDSQGNCVEPHLEDGDPMDEQGHGTHVAAIAASIGSIDPQLKGVAPDASIVAYRAINEEGVGLTSWIIAAIERSVDPNQDGNFSDHLNIISLSLGGYGFFGDPISTAVDNAVESGVIAVVAAGNNNCYYGFGSICSPGIATKAITVGASYNNNSVGSTSNLEINGLVKESRPVSIVTPNEDWIEGQVLYAPSYIGGVADFSGNDFTGKIALIDAFDDFYYRPYSNLEVANILRDAADAGAIGAIFYVPYQDASPSPYIFFVPEVSYIPAVTISAVDGVSVYNNLTNQTDIIARIRIKNEDRVAPISSRGPTFIGLMKPDVIAPGVKICAAQASQDRIWQSYSTYGIDIRCGDWGEHIALSGTSMATPHVSGAVALLLQKNPQWSPEEVKYALRNGAIQELNDPFRTQGQGRIDALNAYNINNPCIARIDPFDFYGMVIDNEANNIIDINGTVYCRNSTNVNYSLSYSLEDTIEEIINPINPTGNTNGTLGKVRLNDGIYNIMLSIHDNMGQIIASDQYKKFYVSKIKEGWPKYYNLSTFALYVYLLTPAVGDIDGDGSNEIVTWGNRILASGTNNYGIYAWHSDGREVRDGDNNPSTDGLLKQTPDNNLIHRPISLGDIDGDGDLEIIAGTRYGVYAWNGDGNVMSGWPQETTKWFADYSPILFDIDGDNDKEIIAVGPDYLYIWDGNGVLIRTIGGNYRPEARLVTDLNLDGDTEFIVSRRPYPADPYNYSLYLFNENGVEEWSINNIDANDLLAGDVDNDGVSEIITYGYAKSINIIDNNGNLKYNFSLLDNGTASGPLAGYDGPKEKIVIGDLNNDGDLELVISIKKQYGQSAIQVWHHNGVLESEILLPMSVLGKKNLIWNNVFPITSDVNGDGNLDIISGDFTPNYYEYGIYAWDMSGHLLSEWPKFYRLVFPLTYLSGGAYTPFAIVADVDNDGNSDLLYNTHGGDLAILNIGHSFSNSGWQMYEYDIGRTSNYINTLES